MSIPRTTEELLVAAKATVVADTPAILTTIVSEAGDSIPLPNFRIHELGYSNVLQRTKYPVIAFSPADADIDTAGQNAMRTYFDILVMIACTDSDPEKLVLKQMRYAEAIRETVQRNSTLGDVAGYAWISKIDYFPAAPGQKKIAVAVLTLSTDTEKP